MKRWNMVVLTSSTGSKYHIWIFEKNWDLLINLQYYPLFISKKKIPTSASTVFLGCWYLHTTSISSWGTSCVLPITLHPILFSNVKRSWWATSVHDWHFVIIAWARDWIIFFKTGQERCQTIKRKPSFYRAKGHHRQYMRENIRDL